MPDLHKQYQQKHLRHVAATNRKIRTIYNDAIQQVSLKVNTVSYQGQPFALKNFPTLKKTIDQVIRQMNGKVYAVITNAITDSWGLANEKNDLIVDRRLAGRKASRKGKQILYDPNKEALDRFIQRKEKGLQLSDRVWKSLQPFKSELEQGLGIALSEGRSAVETARDLQQYLNDPDRLFRRVRNDEGDLMLSRSAKNYHPGQGVYRSSYKNALRLTGSENNIAYRTADFERWQQLPFVTGIEIKLSANHPTYDICDTLAGQYPKDFKWTGWHPQCICYQVPKMMSDEQYSELEDQILAGGAINVPKSVTVNNMPASFNKYIDKNADRISGYKNKPYWVRDNPEFVTL